MLSPRLRPLDLPADTNTSYADTVEHHGSLRLTVKALRAMGVSAVVPGSAAGVELAERIAWHLGRPSADPASSPLRYDRGAQATALERAGVPALRGVRSSSLAEALRWADAANLDGYSLAPATVGTPVPAVLCANEREIEAAWPALRRAAARHSGAAQMVLTERVAPRAYVIHSVTAPGPAGLPEHGITDVWSEVRDRDGALDRTDLLDRGQLLTRALSMYVLRVLDVLGVACGPVTCRVVFSEGRGPLLVSALAAPPPLSPADAVMRAAIGADPVARAVDAWLPAPTAEPHSSPLRRRVVRVHLRTAPNALLGRIVRRLPTVAAVSDDLAEGAGTPAVADQSEVVLSSSAPEAVETDYRVLRALERETLARKTAHKRGAPTDHFPTAS
ncbi:hypothetical protein [Streptomyces olivaceus]|uniref:hypothetical protein n=1 Tax=Streptomyces olivaceus TaxID=47716 RepID=UPI002493AA1E|nr:hypothetical protein [Streptomyces olivaceus]